MRLIKLVKLLKLITLIRLLTLVNIVKLIKLLGLVNCSSRNLSADRPYPSVGHRIQLSDDHSYQ